MKIIVSACLLGENCKYSGGNNTNESVKLFSKNHTVFSVCPEVLGGLPVPRNYAEICDGIVRTQDGTSVDNEFRNGANSALKIALDNSVDLAILQARSPSCGCGKIYDGTFRKQLIDGNGVFAQLLLEHNIPIISSDKVKDSFPENTL